MRVPPNHPAIGVYPEIGNPMWFWRQPLLTWHRLEPRMPRAPPGSCHQALWP